MLYKMWSSLNSLILSGNYKAQRELNDQNHIKMKVFRSLPITIFLNFENFSKKHLKIPLANENLFWISTEAESTQKFKKNQIKSCECGTFKRKKNI